MNLPSTDALLLRSIIFVSALQLLLYAPLLFVICELCSLLNFEWIYKRAAVGRAIEERNPMRSASASSSSIVTNMSRIGSGSGSKRDTPSWMFIMVALGIGYVMGSSFPLSLATIGRSSWKGIIVLEEWVREVVVPCYTLSALLYLLLRNHNDSKEGTTSSSSFGSSLSSSLRKLPALRILSSLTASSEEEAESLATSPLKEEEDEGEKPIDMNGTYKVVENNNFGEFLKAQGVPWFLCNAASKARPTHQFTHASSKKLTIKIQGIIESQTSYQINGPHTETSIRGRVFQDSLSYLHEGNNDNNACVGVRTRKIAVGEGYMVQVERRVIRAGRTWEPTPEENPDGHCTYDLDTVCDFDRLIMTNKVVYDGDEEPVIASQLFHRTD